MKLDLDPVALDDHITGHYGEDQFPAEIPEIHLDEISCRTPGPRGCQMCDACANYADSVYDW